MAKHTFKDGIGGKVCTKCGEWKSLDRFYVQRKTGDGLTPACKECVKARTRGCQKPCLGCGVPIYPKSTRCRKCAQLHRYENRFEIRDGIKGKPCSQCGKWKPLGEFYAKPKASDGRTAACKACTLQRQREARPYCVDCEAPIDHGAIRCVRCNGLKQCTNNRAKHYATKDGIEGKTCTKCHEWKLLDDYARRSRNPDGLSYRCRGCLKECHSQYVATHRKEIKAQQRHYYEKNKEALLARMHKYNEAHKKELSAYKKAWANENKERLMRKRREYYLENCERLRAYSLQWSRENPDKKHEYKARRRARKAGGVVEAVDIQAVYERGGSRCAYCGRTKDLTIDHVEPLAKNGAHHKDNLVVACKKCNSEKGTKWLGIGEDHWLPWGWHGSFPYEEIYQMATP